MPSEPIFLVLSLFADFARAMGSIAIKIPPAPPFQSLALISFGKRRSKPIWEMLPAEEAGTMSRSARLYLTAIFAVPLTCPNPKPRLPPLPPLRRLSCTIGALCRPCSPCSSCAIVVWATGYFLLGAKDYSVIRNVCLSGRLRNVDYK